MREREVESAFVRAGERRGCWILKFAILGRRGFPDRLCLAPGGRVAFCELKRPSGEKGPLQDWVHRKLRELGFNVAVIDHPSDVEHFYVAWLGR